MFRIIKKKDLPLLLLVLVNLIIGLLVLPGFGESVDEFSQNIYADRTIQAVQSLASHGFMSASFNEIEPEQGSHGPAFIVVVTLLRRLFLPDGSETEKLYFNHFLYFLVFQIGIVSIFFLAKRWVSEAAALGTAILFNTQPIFLGHAFMNPKDVVFMSLMTASVAVSLWMVDRGGQSFQITEDHFRDRIRSFFREFLQMDVWSAGLLLGFSSAVRLAAPLVVVIVLVYIFISRKWQVLPKFLAYCLIAFCCMVILWPYLWSDPLVRLFESVLNSAQYPSKHITLFNGTLFDSNDIPSLYLLVLLAIQLTLPTLLLVLVGIYSLFKKIRWDRIALFLIWFALPAMVIIVAEVNLYNNFRQFFFILPPIFLVAGLGLDWLLKRVRHPVVGYLILFLVLFPGLYANVKLYPYQYVYYNELVGGLDGAYRRFDLDYWNLAYKEAQLYVNQVADQNANIYVNNAKYIAQTFARPDLIYNEFGSKNWMRYDFIIVTTNMNSDQQFDLFETVFVVEREGVPFAYVKKPKSRKD